MDKRNIITALTALAIAIGTVALVLNPEMSVTVGTHTLYIAPAFFIGTLVFFVGMLVAAMTQEA